MNTVGKMDVMEYLEIKGLSSVVEPADTEHLCIAGIT